MSTGEYRGKIIIEADGSEVQQATKQVNNMAAAFTGANAVFLGTREVMRGNYQGFLELAVGARVLWTALGAVNIYLKIATVALSALGPIVGKVISTFRDSKPIENYSQRIERLGLAISDLEKHKQSIKKVADDFGHIKEAADAAREAIEKVGRAQVALNSAQGTSRLAALDLEEASMLAGATTDTQRADIRKEYANRREAIQVENIESDYTLKKKQSAQGLEGIRGEWAEEERQRRMLESNVTSAKELVGSTVQSMIATIVSSEDFSKVPMSEQWRARMRREKEITAEFNADPTKASIKYQSRIGDVKFKELEQQIADISIQKDKLSEYDAGAGMRATDRSGRYAAAALTDSALDEQRKSALLAVREGRMRALQNINSTPEINPTSPPPLDKDAAKEKERLIEVKKEEGRYLFDKADPERQLAYLERVLRNMSGKDLTAEQRETRLEIIKLRDRVVAKLDETKKEDQKAVPSQVENRDQGYSYGKLGEIGKFRTQEQTGRWDAAVLERKRSSFRTFGGMDDQSTGRSVDTSALFAAYYAGGVNKTSDAQQLIADRAREQVQYLKIIATAMKGSSE